MKNGLGWTKSSYSNPSTRSDCTKPCPSWVWTLPGIGHPQPISVFHHPLLTWINRFSQSLVHLTVRKCRWDLSYLSSGVYVCMGFLASCNSGRQATRVSNVTGLLVLRQIPKFCQTNHALNLCQWREPGVTCSDGDTCIEGIHAGQIDFTYRGVFEEGFWLGYTLWEFTPVTPKKTLCDQLASCFDHRTVMQTSVKNQSSSHIWSSTGHQKPVNNDFTRKYHRSLFANGNDCAA